MESQTITTPNTTKIGRRKRLYTILVIIVLIFLAFAIYSLSTGGKNQTAQTASNDEITVVRITDKGFEPSAIQVKKGTKVVWTNTGSASHQVISNPYPKGTDLPDLKSEILNNDQTYTYNASTVGSFGYHDQLKPTQNGTIIVQEE